MKTSARFPGLSDDGVAPVPRGATAEAFEALWTRSVPSHAKEATRVAEQLLCLYSEPVRQFHNLRHISDCLRYLEDVRSLVRAPDMLELALWFHDAIYVPGATDNEQRSVKLFLSLARDLDPKSAKHVTQMILATRHGAKHETGDCGYMVDIDLAGFGAPWVDFMRKGDELRDEYASQPDDEYYRGQVVFLSQLRRRPHFYCTTYFRTRYETTAQENLRRLLELRTQQGYGSAG